jgi:hypothetical protein
MKFIFFMYSFSFFKLLKPFYKVHFIFCVM